MNKPISDVKLTITSFNYPPYQIMIGERHGIDIRSENDMASIFDLTLSKYRDILINGGAYDLGGQLVFDNREDCENAIQQLEPYLIIEKLTSGDNAI